MTIATPQDMDGLRRAGAAVAEARDTMLAAVKPGVTTLELDLIGKAVLDRHGAQSAPKLAYNFPGYTCISVNADLAHGIPSAAVVLKEGDLVNVDVSAELNGYWSDTGASAAVGVVSKRLQELLAVTRKAQWEAMMAARAGMPTNIIGKTISAMARRHDFRVIANLTGHGIGRSIHEPPEILNTYNKRDTRPLREGLVITIEPFLTIGDREIVEAEDGWTLRSAKGSLGAQFEHTFIVQRGEPVVLTLSG